VLRKELCAKKNRLQRGAKQTALMISKRDNYYLGQVRPHIKPPMAVLLPAYRFLML